MAIINSFVIYRSHQPMDSRVRQLKYQMDLANALITPLIEKRNATLRPVTRSPTVPERLLGKHFPYKNEVREGVVYVVISEKLVRRKDENLK